MSSPAADAAEYLRHIAAAGKEYKALSYELLALEMGLSVLEVGCGLGLDLPALAERVGPSGRVVGIEVDYDLLHEAQAVTQGWENIAVVRGGTDTLGGDGYFDRVRADWALQHVSHPRLAVAEMWRALGPGGILLLIEPDFQAAVVFPGSPRGGNNNQTVQSVLAWSLQCLPHHGTLGRQLKGLLQQLGYCKRVEVQVGTLLLDSWQEADRILRLSAAAHALVAAEPARANEVQGWLRIMEQATQYGEFVAFFPVVFALAQREWYLPFSGRPSGER